jgi:hypothetical protein
MEINMALVSDVDAIHAHILKLPAPFKPLISIAATGRVPTTGWTNIRLMQRYYIVPPKDGIWDFDMIGDEPSGIVGEVVLPVSAHAVEHAPNWCVGIRVHARNNHIEAKLTDKAVALAETASKTLAPSSAIVQRHLGSYDDSFQPTGRVKFDPFPHVEMKKLHHDLTLIVTGPDEARIRSCINEAIAAGLLAAIVAALATLGAALPAAISAFLARLEGCLGQSFSARIENQSHWEYWWT